MTKLTIEQTDNGYILSWFEEWEDFVSTTSDKLLVGSCKEVIEEDDTEAEDKKAMTKLLERVAEFFGVNYDKWREDNLLISWTKKGHKVE